MGNIKENKSTLDEACIYLALFILRGHHEYLSAITKLPSLFLSAITAQAYVGHIEENESTLDANICPASSILWGHHKYSPLLPFESAGVKWRQISPKWQLS